MRKICFTEAQIIEMIKEQEAGVASAEMCRKPGLSPATCYQLKPSMADWSCPTPAG